jgi:hypothetical protein
VPAVREQHGLYAVRVDEQAHSLLSVFMYSGLVITGLGSAFPRVISGPAFPAP